jgi:drug/metabolite transporter (DMT)-like permease
MISAKKTMYFLMGLVVCCWGLEYVFVKQALVTIEIGTLVFFKYAIGAIIVLAIQLVKERKLFLPGRRDLVPYIACAIFGQIAYCYCEYVAMDYLPVSLITIALAFVPVVSLMIEGVFFKMPITKAMLAGAIVCVVGVGMVIGADYRQLFSGRLIGYLLAFGAVGSWNAYNFITASLQDRYSSMSLTLNQLICTTLLLLPYAVSHIPAPDAFTPGTVGGILYLGIMSEAISFLILVKAIRVIGVTPSSMYSNFIPVTSTFFGWVFLGEMISPIQFVGGAVIILSACVVIREKEKVLRHAALVETEPSGRTGQ